MRKSLGSKIRGIPKRKKLLAIGAVPIIFLISLFLGAISMSPIVNLEAIDDLRPLSAEERILVIAPHPDDEILGAGGLIKTAVNANLPVKVVYLTSGDGSEATRIIDFKKIIGSKEIYLSIGRQRMLEARRSLEKIGVLPENLVFLGYPDGGLIHLLNKYYYGGTPYLSRTTGADRVPYNDCFNYGREYYGRNMVEDLSSIIKDWRPTIIFTAAPYDHHPDHQAGYIATLQAIEFAGQQGVEVYKYLVHYKHWPYPTGLYPEKDLLPPPRYSLSRQWVRLDLGPDVREEKLIALREYASQLRIPELGKLMRSFIRMNELYEKVD